jgi:hypothetical protein
MKKIIFKNISLILLLLVLTLSSSMLVFGYFEYNNTKTNATLNTGSFSGSFTCYLDGVPLTSGTPYLDETNLVLLDGKKYAPSITPPANHVSRFSASITIETTIPVRFRIKIQSEWIIVRSYLDGTVVKDVTYYLHDPDESESYLTSPIGINPDFKYKRYSEDERGFYYFAGIGSVSNGIIDKNRNGDNKFTATLLGGGAPVETISSDNYSETCEVHVSLVVEIVQANRFAAIWAIPDNFYNV